MISKKSTIKLQRIIKTEYGVDLSFAEAVRIGNDLVDLFETLAKMNFDVNYKPRGLKKRINMLK